jgi:hypothetical protein
MMTIHALLVKCNRRGAPVGVVAGRVVVALVGNGQLHEGDVWYDRQV